MANKFVAVFLLFIVVVAAVNVHQATATGEVFKDCYEKCQKECDDSVKGETFCEMKCDTDCGAKEIAAKLEEYKNKLLN